MTDNAHEYETGIWNLSRQTWELGTRLLRRLFIGMSDAKGGADRT